MAQAVDEDRATLALQDRAALPGSVQHRVRYRPISIPRLTGDNGNAVIPYNYNADDIGRLPARGRKREEDSLSARTTVAIWKQPYSPGNPPLGTFSLETVAELTGLSAV